MCPKQYCEQVSEQNFKLTKIKFCTNCSAHCTLEISTNQRFGAYAGVYRIHSSSMTVQVNKGSAVSIKVEMSSDSQAYRKRRSSLKAKAIRKFIESFTNGSGPTERGLNVRQYKMTPR